MFSKCKETRERRVTKRDIKVIVTGRGEKPRECFFFFFFPAIQRESSKRDFESF